MRTAWLILLLAFLAPSGCAPLGEPAEAASPWAGLSALPPRPPAAPHPVRSGPEDCPTLDELRGLLGASADAPELVALQARLGTPALRKEARRQWEDYPQHGLSLGIDDSGELGEITLHRKGHGTTSSYCGALPDGLDFSMNDERFEQVLGPPERDVTGFGEYEKWWVARGYRVVFLLRERKLATFSLRLPVAPREARIANVAVTPDRVSAGLRSVEVVFDYEVNVSRERRGDTARNAVIFWVQLRDTDGTPLHRRGPKASRGANRTLRYAYRAELTYAGRSTIAVPYYLLDLPRGRHDLRLDITAELELDGQREDATLTRSTIPDVTIDMPEVRWVSVGVDTIEVVDEAYDSFGFKDQSKPDIFWEISYPGHETIYTSPVRSDRLRARYRERSPFFPVVDGDRLHLAVFDHDVAPHDGIGQFSLTLDAIAAGGAHSAGRVTSLTFWPMRTRPQ